MEPHTLHIHECVNSALSWGSESTVVSVPIPGSSVYTSTLRAHPKCWRHSAQPKASTVKSFFRAWSEWAPAPEALCTGMIPQVNLTPPECFGFWVGKAFSFWLSGVDLLHPLSPVLVVSGFKWLVLRCSIISLPSLRKHLDLFFCPGRFCLR